MFNFVKLIYFLRHIGLVVRCIYFFRRNCFGKCTLFAKIYRAVSTYQTIYSTLKDFKSEPLDQSCDIILLQRSLKTTILHFISLPLKQTIPLSRISQEAYSLSAINHDGCIVAFVNPKKFSRRWKTCASKN